MKMVIPRIECSVKEAFKSFADDYLKERNHLKTGLDKIKASQEYSSQNSMTKLKSK